LEPRQLAGPHRAPPPPCTTCWQPWKTSQRDLQRSSIVWRPHVARLTRGWGRWRIACRRPHQGWRPLAAVPGLWLCGAREASGLGIAHWLLRGLAQCPAAGRGLWVKQHWLVWQGLRRYLRRAPRTRRPKPPQRTSRVSCAHCLPLSWLVLASTVALALAGHPQAGLQAQMGAASTRLRAA